MTEQLPIRYYFGTVNRAVMAVMSPIENGIRVHSDYGEHDYTYNQLDIRPALGQMNPVINLDNDARIELLQRDIPSWVKPRNKLENSVLSVWKLENNLPMVFVSFIATIAVILALFRYGVPLASDAIASQLPEATLASLGKQVEEELLEETGKTTLSKKQQQHIRMLYEKYVEKGKSDHLRFVSGEYYDANAFALPNGTIFLTDELVEISQNDYELLAVLAHERGHVAEKHSLRQALNMLGVGAVITFISGDVSDLALTLPTLMLGMSYSRSFEYEADDYARKTFEAHGLDKRHISNMLLRLEDGHYESSGDDSHDDAITPSGKLVELLSTHPSMLERTKRINGQTGIIDVAVPAHAKQYQIKLESTKHDEDSVNQTVPVS